ncbi:unnamed protein product [Arabidopsis halleri]
MMCDVKLNNYPSFLDCVGLISTGMYIFLIFTLFLTFLKNN